MQNLSIMFYYPLFGIVSCFDTYLGASPTSVKKSGDKNS